MNFSAALPCLRRLFSMFPRARETVSCCRRACCCRSSHFKSSVPSSFVFFMMISIHHIRLNYIVHIVYTSRVKSEEGRRHKTEKYDDKAAGLDLSREWESEGEWGKFIHRTILHQPSNEAKIEQVSVVTRESRRQERQQVCEIFFLLCETFYIFLLLRRSFFNHFLVFPCKHPFWREYKHNHNCERERERASRTSAKDNTWIGLIPTAESHNRKKIIYPLSLHSHLSPTLLSSLCSIRIK